MPSSTRSTPSKRSTRSSSRVEDSPAPRTPENALQEAEDGIGTPSRRPASQRSGRNSRVPSTPSNVGRSTRASSVSDIAPIPPTPTTPGRGLGSDLDLNSPINFGTPSSLGSLRTPRSSGGLSGTPSRRRVDISSERSQRQVRIPELPTIGERPEAQPASQGNLVVWGTDIDVSLSKSRFKEFLEVFVDAETQDDGIDPTLPYYMQKLEEIATLEEPFLPINCNHLRNHNASLYYDLIRYPQEVIPAFDMAVNEVFFEKYPDGNLPHQIQVRPYNADKTKNMRMLNPEDIDQLITVSGMVIRTSMIIPEMQEAFFKCTVCDHCAVVEVENGRISEPTKCQNCNTAHGYQLVHNRSTFTDKQLIKLQESPEDMPAGQTPHTVVLFAHNDLVDSVQPGDRVTVTGIYRAVPLRVIPRMQLTKSVFKTHVDVIHFQKVDEERLREDSEGKGIKFTPERIEMIKEVSKKPDIYERLANAIAPSIYEHEDIKKGILLQLFGGTKKDFTNSGRGAFRSEINILLCGDPGTSKSQLLQYVYNLVPRSQYTSGKGSSAVGLTAYVTKDPETRQLVLQTGALVLADNGVCCIDEFDKMNDSTRSILHEVMEQQTLSIAKAGIICQLNARTSILAAANPVESQWNTKRTIIENIQLPHTLLSRFDLIFLMLDPQNDTYDRRLARHLVQLYYRSHDQEEEELMDMNILRDYISYAKENIHPKLGDEASQRLIEAYVDMRRVGAGRGQITAYPRQLESLIRLAEAHAKMRLSDVVELVDVEEAYRLHREALKQSATDPMSGKIDVSILTTGVSSASRKRRVEVAQALKQLIETKGNVATLGYQKLYADFREGSQLMITREMFEDALKDLQDDGVIIVTSRSTIRVCHQ